MNNNVAFDRPDAASPAAGWLFDQSSGRLRWWDGERWTDLAQPMAPARYVPAPASRAGYASVMSGPVTPTSRNAAAKTSLVLILLAVLGLGGVVWFVVGRDPLLAYALGLVALLMLVAACILGVVGLVTAVRRPTKKREAIFGIVASSALLIFILVRGALAAGSIDAATPTTDAAGATHVAASLADGR